MASARSRPASACSTGTISPGLSPGVIEIDGDYEQTADGVLKVEVGGLDPGQFDVLVVNGNATLAGSVDLHFINGFAPQAGDTVDFLQVSGTVNGGFQSVSVDIPVDPNAGPPEMIVAADFSVTPDGKLRMTVTNVTAGSVAVSDSQAAQTAPPATSGCGAGMCGAGVAPLLPLTLAGVGWMRMRGRKCQPIKRAGCRSADRPERP